MKRVIIGIALMLVAFAELFLFIGGPENKLVADVMTAVNCKPGERFTEVLGGYTYDSDGGRGQEFTYYCQGDEGQRDVTGTGVIAGIVGYLIPFLAGLALTITGGNARSRSWKQKQFGSTIGFVGSSPATSLQTDPFGNPIQTINLRGDQPFQSATVFTLNGKQPDLSSLPPEKAKMVEQLLGNLGTMMNAQKFTLQGDNLTDKLKQLQDARDKNLITQEEFDRIRKEILDHLG